MCAHYQRPPTMQRLLPPSEQCLLSSEALIVFGALRILVAGDNSTNCNSVSYILRISYQTIVEKSPWVTRKKLRINIVLLGFIPLHRACTPTPPHNNFILFLRHFGVVIFFCKLFFFILACNFLVNQHCLRGGGGCR